MLVGAPKANAGPTITGEVSASLSAVGELTQFRVNVGVYENSCAGAPRFPKNRAGAGDVVPAIATGPSTPTAKPGASVMDPKAPPLTTTLESLMPSCATYANEPSVVGVFTALVHAPPP